MPSHASPQERKAAFERLHSASRDTETTVTVSGNTVSTSVTHSLVLANGETVYHAEDILPVLDERTPSARRARDADSSATNVAIWGVAGIALGTLGLSIALGGIEDSVENDDSTVYNVGMGMIVGSVIPLAIAYYYRSKHLSDTKAAFATYDESLLSTLDLCVRGNRVEDCSGGSVATEVLSRRAGVRDQLPQAKQSRPVASASPEVGTFKLIRKPDAATGTESILFRYTAAPGIHLKFSTRFLADEIVADTVAVSVTCEGLSKDQFTDESMLALVLSKDVTVPLELTRRVNQLRGGITQEVVEGTLSTTDFVRQLGSLEGLEIRVGNLEYALPSKATIRLAEFATYLGKKSANVADVPTAP